MDCWRRLDVGVGTLTLAFNGNHYYFWPTSGSLFFVRWYRWYPEFDGSGNQSESTRKKKEKRRQLKAASPNVLWSFVTIHHSLHSVAHQTTTAASHRQSIITIYFPNGILFILIIAASCHCVFHFPINYSFAGVTMCSCAVHCTRITIVRKQSIELYIRNANYKYAIAMYREQRETTVCSCCLYDWLLDW